MWHMAHVLCNMSHVIFFSLRQCVRTSWWRVCYQRGLPSQISTDICDINGQNRQNYQQHLVFKIPHEETLNLLTHADSSTDTKKIQLVRQNSQKKKNFFYAAILHPLGGKVFKSKTTSFHYFYPRIPKI